MDVLKDIELQTIKNHFVYAFRKYTRRAGSAAMLEWLENETDFFTAPASAEHHCAYPGGLLIHSLNVYNRLRKITIRDMTTRDAPGGYHLSEEQEETVAVLGLLHDVCKVGVYHKMDPFKDVLENKWAPYMFRDPFPLGHGEKSLFLITRHMALAEEEAMAIRWHMGAYDNAVKGGDRAMNEAMKLTPWVWRLQEADMCATHIDEREG